ncbi:MAG: hypothetical protein H7233_01255, partial [Pseudorhodobacter sp.]|nr:hypothetical protein [Frankiaceae bacterium]
DVRAVPQHGGVAVSDAEGESTSFCCRWPAETDLPWATGLLGTRLPGRRGPLSYVLTPDLLEPLP